jgi:hypothetical protein
MRTGFVSAVRRLPWPELLWLLAALILWWSVQ